MIVSQLKIKQTLALRGKRSRNKVSVGEPAEGSFIIVCSSITTVHFAGSAGNSIPIQVVTVSENPKYLKFSTMDI